MGGRLAGKVAIVTGAGRNIGRAEALALASEGASILVNDIDGASAEETVALLRDAGAQARPFAANISTWAAAEATVGAALDAFGRIDILINNAGLARPRRIDEMSEADWDDLVDVHLKGYAAMIRHVAPHFIAQRSGTIVNTGSTSGLGQVRMANYSAPKEGVAGLTRAVARDLGEFGVRCNMLRPVARQTGMSGPAMTHTFQESMRLGFPVNGPFYMWPNGPAAPEHVAAMALLLCLPATAHVSGQEFYINGVECGRFRGPELIRSQYRPDGWTIEALESPQALPYLLDGVTERYVSQDPGAAGKAP